MHEKAIGLSLKRSESKIRERRPDRNWLLAVRGEDGSKRDAGVVAEPPQISSAGGGEDHL